MDSGVNCCMPQLCLYVEDILNGLYLTPTLLYRCWKGHSLSSQLGISTCIRKGREFMHRSSVHTVVFSPFSCAKE